MGASTRAERAHAYENPRPEVAALVPAGATRVLDLGCASGALGAALKQRQDCEVVGVELDPGYAADAARRLDRVVRGDLDVLAASDEALADLGRYDCVVAADVLEHLRDPWLVLGRLVPLLEPGGACVVSLPNVRHWETFWQLGVRGTWPRRSTGIFDATHLRWFTLRDAWVLLADAGLDVEAVRRVGRVRPDAAPDSRAARALLRTPLRTFVTFQHVLRGRRPGRPLST
jgi:methionine biosynthesis protein MetW